MLAEGVAGGFSAVYGELRLMEEAGLCQRGYFVEGLGGAQFALPAAVERLRDVREPTARGGATAVLSAVDPASPYGAAVPWPETAPASWPARPARGWCWWAARLALYVERGGRGLVLVDPDLLEPGIEALATLVATAASSGWRSSASTASRWPAPKPSGCWSLTASCRRRGGSCCVPEGHTLELASRRLRPLVGTTVREGLLAGATVVAVEARGKHLLVHADDGRSLDAHLGMHGSVRLTAARARAAAATCCAPPPATR